MTYEGLGRQSAITAAVRLVTAEYQTTAWPLGRRLAPGAGRGSDGGGGVGGFDKIWNK